MEYTYSMMNMFLTAELKLLFLETDIKKCQGDARN